MAEKFQPWEQVFLIGVALMVIGTAGIWGLWIAAGALGLGLVVLGLIGSNRKED